MVGDADGSAHLELRLSARIGLSGQQRRRRLQAEKSLSRWVVRTTASTITRHSTGSSLYDRCTTETGHLMCSADDPVINWMLASQRAIPNALIRWQVILVPCTGSSHQHSAARAVVHAF